MTSSSYYSDAESSERDEGHEHDWQRSGPIGSDGANLIIEYICINGECDARFSEVEPIEEEEVGMLDSWPFDRDDERGEGY